MSSQLARWYDIEVIYKGKVPSVGFWAQLSKKRTLSEVLESIEQTNNIHFKMEGRTVIVTK